MGMVVLQFPWKKFDGIGKCCRKKNHPISQERKKKIVWLVGQKRSHVQQLKKKIWMFFLQANEMSVMVFQGF